MSTRTVQRQAIVLSIAIALGSTTSRHAIVSAQAPVQPFYLTQATSAMNLTTGAFAALRTKTIARRADGTTAVVDGFAAAIDQIRKVMSPNGDANDRMGARTDSRRRGRPMIERPTNSARGWNAAHSDCVAPNLAFDEHGQPSERFLRFEIRNGQQVSVIEQRSGTFVLTSWKAPALACEELSYMAEETQSDGSVRRTIDSVTTSCIWVNRTTASSTSGTCTQSRKPSVGLASLGLR